MTPRGDDSDDRSRTVASLLEREVARRRESIDDRGGPSRPDAASPAGAASTSGPGWNRRRGWVIAIAVVLMWSAWRADLGPGIVNPRGWPSVQRFVSAAARPDLSPEFLEPEFRR